MACVTCYSRLIVSGQSTTWTLRMALLRLSVVVAVFSRRPSDQRTDATERVEFRRSTGRPKV